MADPKLLTENGWKTVSAKFKIKHNDLQKALTEYDKLKDVSFEFIVCEGKPHPCVMVAKKITPKHKEQLSKAAGSKRFLHLGTCRFEDGKYNFAMEKPVAGLARKLQESIKHHTGKKFA